MICSFLLDHCTLKIKNHNVYVASTKLILFTLHNIILGNFHTNNIFRLHHVIKYKQFDTVLKYLVKITNFHFIPCSLLINIFNNTVTDFNSYIIYMNL